MGNLVQYRTKTGQLIGHPVHSYGYKRDPGVHGKNGFYELFERHPASKIGAGSLPDLALLIKWAPGIWNQDKTSSCTGHAFACSETTTLGALGHPLATPVLPRVRYALGRAVDRTNPSQPLVDEGAQPNSLVRAAALWGVVLEGEDTDPTTSPAYEQYLDAHVNDDPKLGELEAGNKRIIVGYNAIADDDPAKATKVMQSLAGNCAVPVAVDAGNDTFQSYDGTTALDYCGADPDHMNCLVGYGLVRALRALGLLPPKMPTMSDDDPLFFDQNSWSPAWGLQGRAVCTQAFVQQGCFSTLAANIRVQG